MNADFLICVHPSKNIIMRFITIFISCFLIFGCFSKSEIQTETIVPVVTSPIATATIEPQKIGSNEVECQNIKGIIGSANISFGGKTVLHFYEIPNTSQSPAQTLRFYEDKKLKMDSFKAEGRKSYNLLNPEMHKLDYYIFDLAVKNRRNGWLEVIVDNKTNETLWLQENKDVKFKDWLQDMKTSFAIGRLNKESNPLLTKPAAMAERVVFKGDESFEVTEIKGNWIKVNSKNLPSETTKKSVSGWIRWRNDDCLLIEMYPFA
jgi:hypothetical protein